MVRKFLRYLSTGFISLSLIMCLLCSCTAAGESRKEYQSTSGMTAEESSVTSIPAEDSLSAVNGSGESPDPEEQPEEKGSTVIYFIPHQDDETLNFFGGIIQDLRDNKDVHIVLLSNGAASNVREQLAARGYDLTKEEFVSARDWEFVNALKAMGVSGENIHIPADRINDAKIYYHTSQIRSIMKTYMALYPDAEVRAPFVSGTDVGEHMDHYAVGEAACELKDQGIIKSLTLFVDTHCLTSLEQLGIENFTTLPLSDLTEEENAAKAKAIAAYSDWDPDNGFYAIGASSVSSYFDYFAKDSSSCCYEYTGDSSERYAGATRYETAALAGENNYAAASGGTVVLASGENFPDALSAGSLGCEILLTAKNSLPASTGTELMRVCPSRVIIVGGSAAVSENVADEVRRLTFSNASGTYHPEVIRISGANRAATAETLIRNLGYSSTTASIIIATGENYADSVSISPYAAKTHTPVLLTLGGELQTSSLSLIESLGSSLQNVIIVGGKSVVSENTENNLRSSGKNVIRLAGTTRYETSAAIADYLLSSGLGFAMRNISFAVGSNFPDALVAGPVSAKNSTVLLLVENKPENVVSVMKFLSERRKDMEEAGGGLRFFGSYTVIDVPTEMNIQLAAG